LNKIILNTEIFAPIQRCFDLATSIDLHKISTSDTKEEAIAGVTEGLIKLNETVTWRAKHFGVWQKLQSQITEYDRPNYFVDEMLKGTFESMKHKHVFKETEFGTLLIDEFEYSSPLGILGKLADVLFLKNYMTRFLEKRNKVIKEFAESDRWKEVLNS